MLGLVAKKLGMTQIFDENGALVPVTVLLLSSNVVCQVKTPEKNGYASIQVGFGSQKEQRLNKPQREFFKKNNLKSFALLKEFRTDKAHQFSVGMELKASLLNVGDIVDVQGTSKGRGFQGVMKRWHFAGGRDSHGCSVSHRVPGSIGQRAYPGRVFPGKKMPGHMGDVTITTKNLKIVAVEAEQNLVLVRGNVPGAKNARVFIYPRVADFAGRVLKQVQATEQKTA